MSVRDIDIKYLQKALATVAIPTEVRRFKAAIAVKPDYKTRISFDTHFDNPFVIMTLQCEDPLARASVTDISNSIVTVMVECETAGTGILFLEARPTDSTVASV
jgi:hypothetical protein